MSHIIKQARQLLLDTIKGVGGPIGGVDARAVFTHVGKNCLKAGFYVGFHGYTRTRSFALTAAVTWPPWPITTRSPLIFITS